LFYWLIFKFNGILG